MSGEDETELANALTDMITDLRSSISVEEAVDHLNTYNDNVSTKRKELTEIEIQELIQSSTDANSFRESYNFLKSVELTWIEPYMVLLKLLSQDTKLKDFLSHHEKKTIRTASASTSSSHTKGVEGITTEDIPQVCNRLVQVVEQVKVGKDKKDLEKNHPNMFDKKLINWSQERPKMTNDFVAEHLKDNVSDTMRSLPLTTQESMIMDDLLSCFLGCQGQFITAEPLTSKMGQRTFRISDQVDFKLKELSMRALCLASNYSLVVRFIENNKQIECGRVNQALGAAMDIMISDYMVFITQLENELKKHSLNIHELWYYIQPVCHTMEKLANISSIISNSNAKGGNTLSVLHDVTLNSVSGSADQDMCIFLTSCAAAPYLESIQKWIFQGVIYDPYDEFMILGYSRLHSSKDIYSDEYWVKRYQIRKQFVPSFLEKVEDHILDCGKYLNVVRECVTTDASLHLAKEETLEYSLAGNNYLNSIDTAYRFASRSLLDLLTVDYHVFDHIKSVKRYLLLQQGDFVIQILDTCEEELLKPIADVIPSRLSTLLEMAIRISSTNDDIYRDNIILCLKPQDLTFQIFKILSIMTDEEQEYKFLDQNKCITGFDAFTLGLECVWPISLVFNHKVMLCYQLLFRHLFYCKYIERLLSRVWLSDKAMNLRSLRQSRGYAKAFSLRSRMIFCIQNLEYYMMEEAIEPHWIEFIQGVSGVENVDEFQKSHWEFLEKCMKDCLLTQPILLKIFRKLLAVCKDYASFITDFKNNETYDNKTFSECIDHFDEEFDKFFLSLLKAVQELSIGDMAGKFINILYRQNFNYFFTDKLQEVDYLNCLK